MRGAGLLLARHEQASVPITLSVQGESALGTERVAILHPFPTYKLGGRNVQVKMAMAPI